MERRLSQLRPLRSCHFSSSVIFHFIRGYIVVLLTTSLSGCYHHETEWRLNSFSAADPSVSKQLIWGFYGIESGFRWAGPTFTVALAPPPRRIGVEKHKPSKLTLSIYFPPAQIERLGPVTITATGSEYQFGKATYDKGGPYDFVVDIPAAASCTNVLPVTFSLNKYLHGSNGDLRDLGVVVNRISLRN